MLAGMWNNQNSEIWSWNYKMMYLLQEKKMVVSYKSKYPSTLWFRNSLRYLSKKNEDVSTKLLVQ